MGLINKEIEELEFEDGVLLNTEFELNNLKNVYMFNKFNIRGTGLETILGFALFGSFILGFLTAGIAWLYIVWRFIAAINNASKSHLVLEFEIPKPENITEKNKYEDNQMFYKGKTELVEEKYQYLKELVSQHLELKVSFEKTDTKE